MQEMLTTTSNKKCFTEIKGDYDTKPVESYILERSMSSHNDSKTISPRFMSGILLSTELEITIEEFYDEVVRIFARHQLRQRQSFGRHLHFCIHLHRHQVLL